MREVEASMSRGFGEPHRHLNTILRICSLPYATGDTVPPLFYLRPFLQRCSQYYDCDATAMHSHAMRNKHVHFSARLHEVAANHSAGIGMGVVDQLWRHCLLLFTRVSVN